MKTQFKCIGFLLLIIITISACTIRTKNPKSEKIEEVITKIEDSDNVFIREVYRLDDRDFLQFMNILNSTKTKDFKPIFELNYRLYQSNILGVTRFSNHREKLINELSKKDLLPSSGTLIWSRNKEYNKITRDSFYYLYMLKEIDPKYNITIKDIEKIEAKFNEHIREPVVSIIFNKGGSIKWEGLTQKAAYNNNNYLAIIFDNLVYSCPKIMYPVNGKYLSFIGFKSIEDANKFVLKIKKNR